MRGGRWRRCKRRSDQCYDNVGSGGVTLFWVKEKKGSVEQGQLCGHVDCWMYCTVRRIEGQRTKYG